MSPTFIVILSSASKQANIARRFGTDRIRTYAWHDDPQRAPYSELSHGAEAMWEAQAKTGASAIPLAMTEWDPRPRIENPVPLGGPYSKGAHY